MLTTKPRKTVRDYMRLPQEHGVELIWGEFVMAPAPDPRHQEICGNLYDPMRAWVKAHDLGKVYFAPIDVILSDEMVVQPDLIFVSKSRTSIIRRGVMGPPDLVVEILSPSNTERDKFVKKDAYAKFGVREYWIVDPEGRTIEKYRLKGRKFEFAGLYQERDGLTSELFPGLRIPLRNVFES